MAPPSRPARATPEEPVPVSDRLSPGDSGASMEGCISLNMNTPTADNTDETYEFTEQEFQFIFGVCSGLSIRDIAERYEIGEDIVQRIIYQKIFDKAGVSTRMELHQFVRAALNGELRRRRGGAAMEG